MNFEIARVPRETSIARPRLADIEAWIEVEAEINRAAERIGVDASIEGRQPTNLAIRLFRAREHINRDWIGVLNYLRSLRNQAAYIRRFDLAPEQAEEYTRLCADVIADLRQLNPRS